MITKLTSIRSIGILCWFITLIVLFCRHIRVASGPDISRVDHSVVNVSGLKTARMLLEGMGVEYVNDVPLVMWTHFIGKPPTGNRLKQLEAIEEWCNETGVTHIHVTQENFMDFKVGYWSEEFEASFPENEESPPTMLSANHLSDYLRAYVGYYFGGGYTDVKSPVREVLNYRDLLMDVANDPNIYLTGAGLPDYQYIACNIYGCSEVFGPFDRYCCGRVVNNPRQFASIALFASRPGNLIFKEIYELNSQYLEDVSEKLRANPPRTWRCCFDYWDLDSENGYPVMWADLMGNIAYPLQEKYLEHVLPQQYFLTASVNLDTYFDVAERRGSKIV